MATSALNGTLRRLRAVVHPPDGDALCDGELLEHYLARRDESAFATLLRRHGPMVLGVCRRVLGHEQDAEDAFQATFLVLVRKGSCVRPRGMVGNWLHGVAYRTAMHARTMAVKRRRKERAMARTEQSPPALTPDLQAALDHEIAALPAKYQAVLVLCDLEGKTRQEAADQLSWPAGTVAGRLSRARALLARRLARRGFAVAAAVAWPQIAAAAPIAPTLLEHTLRASVAYAAGRAAAVGAVSSKVITLTEGVLKAMLLTKLRVATGLLAAVALSWVTIDCLRSPAAADARSSTRSQPQAKSQSPPVKSALPDPHRPDPDKAKKAMEKLYNDPLTFIHSMHSCTACHLPQLPQSQIRLRTDIERATRKLGNTGDRERDLDALDEIDRAVQALRSELRKRDKSRKE